MLLQNKHSYLFKMDKWRYKVAKQFIQEINMLVLESSFSALSVRLLRFQLYVGIWRTYYSDNWCLACR